MNSPFVASDSGAPVSAATTFTSTSIQRSNSVDSIQGTDDVLSGFGFFLELGLAPDQTPAERNALTPQGTIIVLPFLFRFSSNVFLAKGLSFVGFSALAGTRHRLGMLGSPTKMTFAPEEIGATFDDHEHGYVDVVDREPVKPLSPLSVNTSAEEEWRSKITVSEPSDTSHVARSPTRDTAHEELEVAKIMLRKARVALKVVLEEAAQIEAGFLDEASPPSSPCSDVTATTQQLENFISSTAPEAKTTPTAAVASSPAPYFSSSVEIVPYRPRRVAVYSVRDNLLTRYTSEAMVHIVCMKSYEMWSSEEMRLIFYQQIGQRTHIGTTTTAGAYIPPARVPLPWEKPCRLSIPREIHSATVVAVAPEVHLSSTAQGRGQAQPQESWSDSDADDEDESEDSSDEGTSDEDDEEEEEEN